MGRRIHAQRRNGRVLVDINGHDPQIVISNGNKVHVVYATMKYEADRPFMRIVERARELTSQQWEDIDVIARMMWQQETCGSEDKALAHCTYTFHLPSATASDTALFVTSGPKNSQNTNSPCNCISANSYKYAACARDRLISPPDSTQLGGVPHFLSGGLLAPEVRGNSTLFSIDTLFWAVRRDGEPLKLLKSDGMWYFTQMDNIPNGHWPTLARANDAKLLMVFKMSDETIHGMRIPRDRFEDIEVSRFITSKARIMAGSNVNLKTSVTATVLDTLILADSSQLTLQPNSKIIIKDKGMVYVSPGARIVLDNASIEMESDSSLIVLSDSIGLQGSGNITGGKIITRKGLRILQGDTLTFAGGTVFDCDAFSVSADVIVNGVMRFTGVGSRYHFGECIDTILVDPGKFETTAGVTLEFLPSIVAWSAGSFISKGTAQDSCWWQFRDTANCDVYGKLIATHTKFEACATDSLKVWDGILVAYENSLIQLDSCYLHQIRVHPSSGGSAIHFYQSLSFDNRINNCVIRRIAGQGYGKLGDAIFLQPGGTSSYVKITCCLIDQDWYSGVGALGSWFDLINTTVTDNNIGVGMNLDSHALLYSNAITGHIFTGVYVRHSFLRFGAFNGPGNNVITENDTTQISIDSATTVVGGMPGNDGFNEISHSSPNKRRVWIAPTAVADLQMNWWGVADSSGFSPDDCLLKKSTEDVFFSFPSATDFRYTNVLCSQPNLFIACDEPYGFSILGKQSSLPPYATSLQDLVKYAREGNFAEVYRFVGNAMAQSSDPARIITAANVALHLEVGHARRFPDSTLTSRTRLTGFLQSRFNASSNALVKSGLLFLWSRALFALGAVSPSESKLNQLRTQFSSSPYARGALPLMQLIAMAKRDTLGMESAVAEMAQAGFNYTQMQQAYNMRRGYYRVLPRSLFQKSSEEAERMVPELESNGQLVARAYPNPFNPSTTIEYAIPETMPVKLRVFDLLGREVARLVDEWQQEGTYAEVFDASHLPSGVYVYVLSTPYSHVSGRLLLMK